MELKPSYKVRLICLLIASPSIMSLNAFGQPCCVFNGYNVGGGLGVVNLSSSFSSNVNQNGLLASAANDITNPGLKGNFFVGYSFTPTNWLVLGAELGVNIVSRRQISLSAQAHHDSLVTGTDSFLSLITATGSVFTQTDLNNNLTVSRNLLEPTFDLKAGLLITPNVMSFARLGVGYNNIRITSSSSFVEDAFQEVNIPFFPFASSSFGEIHAPFKRTKSNGIFSLRGGFGFTGMITPSVGISGDYVYSFYNTNRLNVNTNSKQISCDIIEGCHVNTDGTYRNRSKARVSDQEILMQLVYYFNC